jgi:hypothetical protein
MFLESDIYSPSGTTYRITTADLNQHKTWLSTINAKMPAGSSYFPEIGHNGNGNIEVRTSLMSKIRFTHCNTLSDL